MSLNIAEPVPVLDALPVTLPRDGAIELELERSALVFRVSEAVQERIEALLETQREAGLSAAETEEWRQYEEIDDYLSFLNRLARNLVAVRQTGDDRGA